MRSKTIDLPTRRTLWIVAPVSACAISSSGDLKVCGLPLVHTRTIRCPRTRAFTPLATVSTSGSSGTDIRCSGRMIGRAAIEEIPKHVGRDDRAQDFRGETECARHVDERIGVQDEDKDRSQSAQAAP